MVEASDMDHVVVEGGGVVEASAVAVEGSGVVEVVVRWWVVVW